MGMLTGLDALRRGQGIGGVPVHVYRTLGLEVLAVSPGHAVMRLPAGPALLGADGRMAAGALGVVADGCCGAAVATVLSPGYAALSAQLRLEFVRPAPGVPGWVECRGTVDAHAEGVALARGELVDSAGEFVAICSLRVLGADMRESLPAPRSSGMTDGRRAEASAVRDPADPADSGDRPAAGGERSAGEGGAGDGPRRLLGVMSSTAGGGRAQLALSPSLAVANSFGSVHGGVLVLLAHLTAADAQRSLLGADEEVVPLDLVVNYLRGVPANGSTVTSTATVAHRGRRFILAEGEVTLPDGRGAIRFSGGSRIRHRGAP